MKNLKNGQNIQIARQSGRLKDLGITHKCYVFMSRFNPNSVQAKDITAYGLQHCSILTAHDDSARLDELNAAIMIEDGEHVIIEEIEYEAKLMGDFSDCIHFREIGYIAKVTKEFYRVKTPLGFGDLRAETLDEAKDKLREFGTIDRSSEHYEYWDTQRSRSYIVKVTETEERL